MQRSSHSRGTRVLAYGINVEKGRYLRSMIKSGLQGAHMGWSLLMDSRDTVDEALEYIAGCKDLEVVYIDANTLIPKNDLADHARSIAGALAKHPHKPWVSFCDELDYLVPVFEAAGITVAQYMLEEVIFERWRSQLNDSGLIAAD